MGSRLNRARTLRQRVNPQEASNVIPPEQDSFCKDGCSQAHLDQNTVDASQRLLPWLWEEEGFSTIGVVVALFIALSLLFTGAQVYQIRSAAANIQEVADASALAAENVIAEYRIVAQSCDAIVLSLSLTSLVLSAVGLVAICVPPAASVGEKLISFGKKTAKARDSFVKKAQQGLSQIEQFLPYLSTARALQIMQANSTSTSHCYRGIVLLSPLQPQTKDDLSFAESDEAQKSLDQEEEAIAQDAKELETAFKKANEAKQTAYEHDCGQELRYTMQKRARDLAGLTEANNPSYTSVETWSFSVPLQRAQAYYQARLSREQPKNESIHEQVNSALRKKFYAYAVEELTKGYVLETEDSFSAYFPTLPHNTQEMRATRLYTDSCYPKSTGPSGTMLHAYDDCPGIEGEITGFGSVASMEAASYSVCPVCEFSATKLGNVGAASSSIENGFEYHYLIVAHAVEEYAKQRAASQPLSSKLKTTVGSLLDELKQAAKQAAGQRITIAPPGRFGALALVVDAASYQPSPILRGNFTGPSQSMSPRIAWSAAVLVKEPSSDGATVISTLLNGFTQQGNPVGSAGKAALQLWSGMLELYTDGQTTLINTIKTVLNSLPLASLSGLGSWAAESLETMFADLGLEPADITPAKPVLINTLYVLQKSEDGFARPLRSIKNTSLTWANENVTSLLGGAVTSVEQVVIKGAESATSTIEIAQIELFNGAISFPITVALPGRVQEGVLGMITSAFSSLRSMAESVVPTRRWE